MPNSARWLRSYVAFRPYEPQTGPVSVHTESEEPLGSRRVQLGHLDVNAAGLVGGGVGLWELIGTARQLDVHAPAEYLDRLPVDGWRVVHARSATASLGRAEMLAAPYTQTPGTWAIVNLAEVDDQWIVSCDPGPVDVFPSRADRRAPLRLSWNSVLTAPAGSPPRLSALLSNTSANTWRNVAGDGQLIVAFLYDEGSSREGFRYVSSARRQLQDLGPGQSVELPVDFQHPAGYPYAPGRYDIDASLIDLDLRCPDAVLTLV